MKTENSEVKLKNSEVKHSEEEGMENDTKNTQEEKRAAKPKRSREKSQAITLANKLKNKYTALDEYAEKLKKKGGYSYSSTSERLRRMREGSVDTVTTPTAGSSDANTPADDLSTLVRDISSMVPVSNIDKTQTRHQVEQNFFESTRLDDENAV